jgi:aryl carrier-like protein
MVPAAYLRLEAMPLTSSGKLDRKALPLPEGNAYLMRTYEAPQGETEKKIAEIWAELFKREQVGRDDNFFELGGTSLLSIHLMSLLRQKGIDITISTVFKYPTIKLLSAAVTDKKQNIKNSCVPLRTTGTQRPLFIVHEVFGDVGCMVFGLQNIEAIFRHMH